jgi:glycosyltransferase involved in cell wall biosynthesis
MFVLNSGYEGLSHTALESMQMDVPLILSDKGGNPELVENNVNGLLVEYNNNEQIKKAIIDVFENKELQNKFISNSKEKLQKFSWNNLLNQTIDVILKK